MCEPCLAGIAQEVKGLKTTWLHRYPPLFWGDYQKLVGRLGGLGPVVRVLGISYATASTGLHRPGTQRIPPWMLRKLYAPLRTKFASHWIKLLPTRCFLAQINGRHRKSPKVWSPAIVTDFKKVRF